MIIFHGQAQHLALISRAKGEFHDQGDNVIKQYYYPSIKTENTKYALRAANPKGVSL
jgi:hypothetical protein